MTSSYSPLYTLNRNAPRDDLHLNGFHTVLCRTSFHDDNNLTIVVFHGNKIRHVPRCCCCKVNKDCGTETCIFRKTLYKCIDKDHLCENDWRRQLCNKLLMKCMIRWMRESLICTLRLIEKKEMGQRSFPNHNPRSTYSKLLIIRRMDK